MEIITAPLGSLAVDLSYEVLLYKLARRLLSIAVYLFICSCDIR